MVKKGQLQYLFDLVWLCHNFHTMLIITCGETKPVMFAIVNSVLNGLLGISPELSVMNQPFCVPILRVHDYQPFCSF